MPDDGPLLLQAILAHPAEDSPRLMYADWLDGLEPVRVPCPKCDGKGELRGDGMFRSGKPCLTCGGVALSPHSHRKGTGTAIDTANADRAAFIRMQCDNNCPSCEGRNLEVGPCGLTNYYRKCYLCASREASETELLARHEFTWASPLGDIGFQANSTWVPECEWECTRGFVSAITLSLAAFMDADRTATIFARHPITRVKLEDRSPWGNFTFGAPANPYGWQWSLTWNLRSSYHIPPAIWDLMDDAEEAPDGVKCFPEAKAAHAALSLAAVNYGRSLAKLPPLTSLPTGL